MARISSSLYCVLPIGSVGDATPPEAMILIWVAPFCSSSRAARRTASTPSATRAMAPARKAQEQGSSTSERGRKSPWPPVCDSALPEGKMRGPGTRPMAMACARPQSAPPASRTLVNPRFNIASTMGNARMEVSEPGCRAFKPRLASEASTCTWQSIRPGITVLPATSITRAPGTSRGVAETSMMRSFSIRTSWRGNRLPSAGSRTLPPFRRILVMAKINVVADTAAHARSGCRRS